MGITIVVIGIFLFMLFKTINGNKKRKQNDVKECIDSIDEVSVQISNNKFDIFSFRGRIKRSTYFWIHACLNIGIGIQNLIFVRIMNEEWWILHFACALIFAWVSYVTTMKRCHDMGQSGWFALIPLYYIVLFFLKGEEKDNKYGLNPYIENTNEWI